MRDAILSIGGKNYHVFIDSTTRLYNGEVEFTGKITASELAMVKNKISAGIKDVIFNDPATIVIWSDGSKTVVKCQENDTYSEELGLAMCIAKKYLGNKGNYNEVFKKWLPKEIPVEEMREALICHCRGKICNKCVLYSNDYRCGRNTFFNTKKDDGSYDMTDNEIRDAYKVVFGK